MSDETDSRAYNARIIGFERDQSKAKSNFKKHGVSFEEFESAFYCERGDSDQILRLISARKATETEHHTQAKWAAADSKRTVMKNCIHNFQ